MAGPGGIEAGRIAVRVLPNTTAFAQLLQLFLNRIEAQTRLHIRTDLDGDHLADQARHLATAAEAAARVNLPVHLDAHGLLTEAHAVAALAQRSARVRLPVDLDLSGLAARAGKIGSLLLSGARLGVTVAALLSAVSAAAHLAAALAPAVGALAAIPALAVGAAAAVGTLKLAFAGLGDALKGDPEALAKLAPAARAVVDEIRTLQPAADELRRTVQQSVFGPLIGQAQGLAQTWLPLLTSRLSAIGTQFGRLFAGLAEGARMPAFVAGIDAALRATGAAIAPLVKTAVPVMEALGRVIGAFAPAIAGAGAGLASLAERFAAFIAAAEQSGALAAFVETVGATLAQIGRILLQLGGIIHAVFSAAQTSGGGFLGNLEQILTAVNAFLSAGEGRTALQALFTSASQVISALLPIVFDLVGALGPAVAVLLGPQGLAGALAALAPAARPVGQALSALATAVAPLLGLLGTVLANVLTFAAGAVSQLAAELGPLLGIVAKVGTAVAQALLPAISTLVAGALPAAVALGQSLADALTPLVPIITEIAGMFVAELLPVLREVQAHLIAKLLPALTQAAQQIGGALLDALRQLAPHLPELARAAAAVALALGQVLLAATPLIPVVAHLLADGLSSAAVIEGVRGLTFGLTLLAGSLHIGANALRHIIGQFIAAKSWAEQTAAAIRGGFAGALRFIGELPGRIRAVFDGARSWLLDAGRNLVQGLLDGIHALLGRAIDTARNLGRSLVKAAEGALGIASPSTVFAGIGTNLVRGFVAGIERAQPVAVRAMSALATPPAAPSFGIATAGIGGPVDARDPVVNLTALVRVGDGPVFDAVETAVSRNPERFAHHVRAGERGLTRRG